MSVPKSKRKESSIEFLNSLRELRILIYRLLNRLPKGWYRNVQENLEKLAADAYLEAVAGNSVFMCQTTDPHDYDLRHRNFMQATTKLTALQSELHMCFDLVDRGNNFFTSREEYVKVFAQCSSKCAKSKELLRKVIKSDKARWARYTISDSE